MDNLLQRIKKYSNLPSVMYARGRVEILFSSVPRIFHYKYFHWRHNQTVVYVKQYTVATFNGNSFFVDCGIIKHFAVAGLLSIINLLPSFFPVE